MGCPGGGTGRDQIVRRLDPPGAAVVQGDVQCWGIAPARYPPAPATQSASRHRYGRSRDRRRPRDDRLLRTGSGSLDAWRREFFSAFDSPGVEAPLELAQHLVHGAVAFARRLGFEPYAEFAAAAVHLGEPAGPVPIEFGREGVPFYVAGPYDDARSVVRTLEAAVGEGNHHYVLPMG